MGSPTQGASMRPNQTDQTLHRLYSDTLNDSRPQTGMSCILFLVDNVEVDDPAPDAVWHGPVYICE